MANIKEKLSVHPSSAEPAFGVAVLREDPNAADKYKFCYLFELDDHDRGVTRYSFEFMNDQN